MRGNPQAQRPDSATDVSRAVDIAYNPDVGDPIQRLRAIRRAIWTPILFLSLFLALVALISVYWVAPMVEQARSGTPADRQRAVAYGTLVLILLLFLMLLGLVASFRFATRLLRREDRKPTHYVDIWKEAGRRVRTPGPDELEDSADDPAK
jgi:uncharacterized membrane protein YbhN (UPF0104 family)